MLSIQNLELPPSSLLSYDDELYWIVSEWQKLLRAIDINGVGITVVLTASIRSSFCPFLVWRIIEIAGSEVFTRHHTWPGVSQDWEKVFLFGRLRYSSEEVDVRKQIERKLKVVESLFV